MAGRSIAGRVATRMVLLSLLICVPLVGCASPARPTGGSVFAQEAVAADHPVASAAGAEMLALGGNAVDAAVAASFTLSVVRPYSCGIGGGGFMLIHLPDDPTHGRVTTAINYRETAPGAAAPDLFERLPQGASTRGGAAVAVPGTVAGLLHALEAYGTLDRKAVLAPAIRAARDGFIVDEHHGAVLADLAAEFRSDRELQRRYGPLWEGTLGRGGIRAGEVVRNREQAGALELIAEYGTDGFYRPPVAQAIVDAASQAGGVLTLQDLENYRVRETRPLVGRVGGRSILTFPPPSSGGVAILQMAGILEAWREQQGRGEAVGSIEGLHAQVEASKHAFADRAAHLADPAFVDVPVHRLLDAEYLHTLASRINPARTQPIETYGSTGPIVEDGGTSHLCVVDRWGGAVACTETINLEFGSFVVAAPYGFALNNEMDDFTTRRGEPNAFGLRQSDANLPAPGKRPLSSMSPTIVLDGPDLDRSEVLLVAGASGGPRIISATFRYVLPTLDGFEQWRGHAADGHRLHHQWMPDVLYLEPEVFADSQTVAALRAIGHNIAEREEIGHAQAIERDGDGWRAHCDPRKGGRPAGR